MNMKYLVAGAVIAGLAGQTVSAQSACCAAPKTVAQKQLNSAQADIKAVKLDIEGMTCGSCAASVKSALGKLDGVRDVQISFEQKGGTVAFDAAKVNERSIVDAVNKSGFKAQRSATKGS